MLQTLTLFCKGSALAVIKVHQVDSSEKKINAKLAFIWSNMGTHNTLKINIEDGIIIFTLH